MIIGPALQSRNGDDISYGTANGKLITLKSSCMRACMHADLNNQASNFTNSIDNVCCLC